MRDLKATIDGLRVHLDLTIEEVAHLKELIEKDALVDGIPSDEGCVCPECGQRVKYIESDTIPL